MNGSIACSQFDPDPNQSLQQDTPPQCISTLHDENIRKTQQSKITTSPVSTKRRRKRKQYKVVVSNLNYRTTWKSLKDHMKTAGEVLTVHVLFMGGRPSGRGVIVYKHKEDALRAVETLDRSVLDGRCIIVRSSGQRKFTFEGCVYTSTSTSVTHSSSSGGNHRRIQNDKKPNSRVSTSDSGTSSNESHPTACRHVAVADLVAKPSPMPAADITSRCPQNATPTISGGTEHVGMSGGDVGGPFTEQHQTTLTEQRTQPNNDPTGDSTQNSTSLSEASHIMHETECGRLNRTVYVRNLSYRTTWQGLKDHMRQAGSIAFTDVFIDRRTRRSLGSGIVRYNSSRSVRVALQTLNGSVLDGRSIHIFANTSE